MEDKVRERGLSNVFMDELLTGFLNPILKLVQEDHTLNLQIREDYINIYYRGGNILKIERKDKCYSTFFEIKYCKNHSSENDERRIKELPKKINSIVEINQWIELIPSIKQIMDKKFSKSSKSEREFQQLVARENNNSIISNDTDYFITDIEYTNPESMDSRFDLIGIKWASQSAERKKGDNCRIALIEMKYGDNALTNTAGIQNHINDIEKFCQDKTKLDRLKNETLNSFKQLRELGLIKFSKNGNKNQIEKFSDDLPEFILLIANHKPSSAVLAKELSLIEKLNYSELKVATSSFMGYGLYDENILTLNEYKRWITEK